VGVAARTPAIARDARVPRVPLRYALRQKSSIKSFPDNRS